jgi:glycosyltransferase involved in cell wall biosynthesis
MRILVTPFTHPWPPVNGSRIRAANSILALAPLGEVECFTLYDPAEDPIEGDPSYVPPGAGAVRAGAAPRGRKARSRAQQLEWFLRGELPSTFFGRDVDTPRRAFKEWAREPYDLVWFHGLESYVTLAPVVDAPVVMDLDVLLDQWVIERQTSEKLDHPGAPLRRWAQDILARKNVRRFQGLHRSVASRVEATLVTNEDDCRTLDVPNGIVVPNGFDPPERPVGKVEVGSPPTILFQANLTRPPKIVASQYLVRRVAPLIWERMPEARIRLAGRPSPTLSDLADPPRVILTGFVPDMTDELAKADIAVVPMRFAGGTLLKVLENFAHKIPVVATSIGARGLGVVDGEHLLIADTPDDFAQACIRLLTDLELRRRLADAAHDLFLRRFQWSAIHAQMRDIATAAALSRGRI